MQVSLALYEVTVDGVDAPARITGDDLFCLNATSAIPSAPTRAIASVVSVVMAASRFGILNSLVSVVCLIARAAGLNVFKLHGMEPQVLRDTENPDVTRRRSQAHLCHDGCPGCFHTPSQCFPLLPRQRQGSRRWLSLVKCNEWIRTRLDRNLQIEVNYLQICRRGCCIACICLRNIDGDKPTAFLTARANDR